MKQLQTFLKRLLGTPVKKRAYISGWGTGSTGSPSLVSYDNKSKLFVGKYTSIADSASFLLGMNNSQNIAVGYPINRNITPDQDRGDITVGSDVRIGQNVVVIGPLIIADGVVIEDGSCVVDDVPAYAVVSGSPAKITGYRYTQAQIEHLLDVMWWNWDVGMVKERLDEIHNMDVDAFIAKYL